MEAGPEASRPLTTSNAPPLTRDPSDESRESDARLVERCLDGDAQAWEVVVRRYGGLVQAVARRAGLSDDDAADVFQTVWRIALENLERLRNRALLGRWLARTAHFQAMRLRRHYAITRKVLGRVEVPSHDDVEPDAALAALEDRLLVNHALSGLGDRCRDLLRLLYFESPTPAYAAIAAQTGMRIGSIGPTRARCLKQLEGELDRGRHAQST